MLKNAKELIVLSSQKTMRRIIATCIFSIHKYTEASIAICCPTLGKFADSQTHKIASNNKKCAVHCLLKKCNSVLKEWRLGLTHTVLDLPINGELRKNNTCFQIPKTIPTVCVAFCAEIIKSCSVNIHYTNF